MVSKCSGTGPKRPSGGGRLTGETALITGAASGIGQAMALLFAAEGAAVAVVDKNEKRGSAVAERIGRRNGRAVFVSCDVGRSEDCRQAVELTWEAFGGLDILVNNAGSILRASVTETSQSDWDRVMEVNLKSVFLMSRFAIPRMEASGGGAIVNTASGWGLTGGRRAASSCAAKGGVVQLTRAMAIDHGHQNIRVNCICPGDTDTSLLRDEARQLGVSEHQFLEEAAVHRPLKRLGRPEDVAQAALFLASDAASFISGAVLVVDGGGLAG